MGEKISRPWKGLEFSDIPQLILAKIFIVPLYIALSISVKGLLTVARSSQNMYQRIKRPLYLAQFVISVNSRKSVCVVDCVNDSINTSY